MECTLEVEPTEALMYSDLCYGDDFVFTAKTGSYSPNSPARRVGSGYIYYASPTVYIMDRTNDPVARIKPKDPVVFVLDTGE